MHAEVFSSARVRLMRLVHLARPVRPVHLVHHVRPVRPVHLVRPTRSGAPYTCRVTTAHMARSHEQLN